MKKLLSFLLSIMLILSVVPMGLFSITASAVTATSGTTGDCTWKLDGTVLTISGNGAMGNYYGYGYTGFSLPWGQSVTEVIIKTGVTSIGEHAFAGCSELRSITIPDSATSIGNAAFIECISFTSVMIPGSITSIGDEAFNGCRGLRSITIPGSVTSIGRGAFVNCRRLTSVTIPESVTSIGNSTFSSCTGLTSVTIPNGVTNIENFAFLDCAGLTSVIIPGSVTSIGESAFERCTGLTSITIPNSVTSIGHFAFRDCTGLTSITIPDSVTSIGNSIFKGCRSLTSVTIPDSIKSIGTAFSGCTGLTSITIPNSVTSIGDYAFSDCTGLTNITIPSSVTSIGNYVFKGCAGLTSITIPNSITSIGDCAFYDCKGLTSITMPNSVTSIGSSAFYFCTGLTSITIPNSVTSIGDDVFYYCTGLTSITIPDSVTSIGSRAFSGCSGLTSITIPNSITRIGNYAFSGCTGLTSITIPDKISIDGNAFKNCAIKKIIISDGSETVTSNMIVCKSTLESITIPNSITSVGKSAFYGCNSLANVYYGGSFASKAYNISIDTGNDNLIKAVWHYADTKDVLLYLFDDNSLTASVKDCAPWTTGVEIPITVTKDGKTYKVTGIGDNAFSGCTKLTNITIPNSVTSIGESSFSGCTGLTSVIIPNSVTSIGSNAFSGCTGLTSVYITDIVAWCNIDFYNYEANPLYYAKNLYLNGKLVTKLVIPNGVISIGRRAFSGYSGLTNVIIPNGVKWIGVSSFSGCTGLTSVTISGSVTSIDESTFSGCTGLTNITIPNSVTSVCKSAFYGCNSLANVYYGGSFASKAYNISIDTGNDNLIKAVWHYADTKDVLLYLFDDNSLTASVKDCAPWTTVVEISTTITKDGKIYKVTGIGDNAFSGCTGLTSITIPNSVTSIGESAFKGCTRLTSITIPNSVTSIGYRAFSGCTGLTSIKIPDSITSIDEYVFKNCTGLTSITIPDSVTSIDKYAFENCKIKELNIAEGSKKVTSQMVMCKDTLEKVTIPNSVTSIGYGAFYGCYRLTSITIPDSVTSIDEYVFKKCTGLTSITIPGSITSIDKYAFSGCENIDTVYYGGTETQWSKLSNKPNCKNVVYCNKIGIKVTKLPSKINYTEGENLSLYGGEVSVLYNNDIYDKSTVLNSSTIKVTGFDTTKPGKQTLTVEYLGYTTAFDVNVIEKPENKTEFAGGKGVEHNPYLVSDKTQLNNVRKYPDAYFKQTKDIEFTAADFATGGMFYNNGYGWMPIGKDDNSSFNGCYDGGGYSIKNLRISITTDNSAYGGLFGYNTGKLKNITVENGNITVKAEKNSYAGAIVGYVRYGNIENCHNKNTYVKANVAGGIAGCVNFTEKIENCSNSGSIEGTFMGGIAGRLTTSSNALISNCTNSGNLVLPYISGAYVGGIVGHHEKGPLKVEDCKNFGRIYAENADLPSIFTGGAPLVGGMIGYTNNSTVKGCINKADIYGYAAGGIVGYGITYITNCINEGNISGSSMVGGIVGFHYYGTIHDCTNKGKITGVEYRENKKVSDYSGSAGGIVGSVKQHNEIQRCRNIGDVYNGYYSGGIAGIGGSIWYCYNTGNVVSQEYSGGISADFKESDYTKNISYCYNTGNIRGKNAAGIIASIGEGTVSNCYTVGRIEKISDEGYIGAIAAYMTGGIIEECYYLNNISSGTGYVDYSVSNEPQTTKLTDKQMQNAESFTDFNFTNIWTMDGNNDYLYPELKDVEMIYIPYTPGDLDGDEKITDKDAIYLLMHSYFPDDYPVNQPLDYNNDGLINDKDAIYLLMHCYFPEDYPITK